jgi:hypothetical protein
MAELERSPMVPASVPPIFRSLPQGTRIYCHFGACADNKCNHVASEIQNVVIKCSVKEHINKLTL